jgi:hypothetical protein
MDPVKAEMKTTRFPRTAQEGFRQCAELSETARRWFRQSIRPAESSGCCFFTFTAPTLSPKRENESHRPWQGAVELLEDGGNQCPVKRFDGDG